MMQVCQFFATTGRKHSLNCTKGCHDDSLVLPHLDFIVCKVLALQGECTNKHCTKSHFKPVVDRFERKLPSSSRSRNSACRHSNITSRCSNTPQLFQCPIIALHPLLCVRSRLLPASTAARSLRNCRAWAW